MAAYSTTAAPTNASDAQFRAWVQVVDDAFINSGWVHSSDTGQLTIASATAPAGGAYAGYKIYQQNDGLTAYFVKIEFGTSSGVANEPSIRVTGSTGSNGSGTLSGNVSAVMTTNLISGASATASTCLISGTTGRLQLVLFYNTVNAVLISVSRTCDIFGAPTSEGMIIVLANSGTGGPAANKIAVVGTAGGAIGVPTVLTATWSGVRPVGNGGSAMSAAALGIFPLIPLAGIPYPPVFDVGLVGSGDIVTFSTFTFTGPQGAVVWMSTGITAETGYTYTVRYD